MDITIRPGAALEDATQIDSIINQIRDDMKVLNDVINEVIPEKITTTWSDELSRNWHQYYGGDVETAMEGMSTSAANLRKAVEKALQYSNEI